MSLSKQQIQPAARPHRGENPFMIYGDLAPQAARIPVRRPAPVRVSNPVPRPTPVHPPSYIRTPGLARLPRCKHSFWRVVTPSRLRIAVMALMIIISCVLLLPTCSTRLLAWMGIRPVSHGAVAALTAVNVDAPVHYAYVSSQFGPRWGRLHQGIDLAATPGAPIYAISGGRVMQSGWESGYGNSIVIDHGNGVQTRYAHCSRLLAPVGKVIRKGDVIAQVGSTGHSTGPHLHFEVIINGVRKNPLWYYHLAPRQGTVNPVTAGSRTEFPPLVWLKDKLRGLWPGNDRI